MLRTNTLIPDRESLLALVWRIRSLSTGGTKERVYLKIGSNNDKIGATLKVEVCPTGWRYTITGICREGKHGGSLMTGQIYKEERVVGGFAQDFETVGIGVVFEIPYPKNKLAVNEWVSDIRQRLRKEVDEGSFPDLAFLLPPKQVLRDTLSELRERFPPETNKRVTIHAFKGGFKTTIETGRPPKDRNNSGPKDKYWQVERKDVITNRLHRDKLPSEYDPGYSPDIFITHAAHHMSNLSSLTGNLRKKLARTWIEDKLKDNRKNHREWYIPHRKDSKDPLFGIGLSELVRKCKRSPYSGDRSQWRVPWKAREDDKAPIEPSDHPGMIGVILALWVFPVMDEDAERELRTIEFNGKLIDRPGYNAPMEERWRWVIYSYGVNVKENRIRASFGDWDKPLPEPYIYHEVALGRDRKRGYVITDEILRRLRERVTEWNFKQDQRLRHEKIQAELLALTEGERGNFNVNL